MSRTIREAQPTDMADIMQVIKESFNKLKLRPAVCKPEPFNIYMEWQLCYEVLDITR